MRPSCSPTCCFRSRPWAWACATSRARSSTGTCAARADLARLRGGAARCRSTGVPGRGDPRCCGRGCAPERALIGFVGGPFTLYAYAVAGSHEGFTRQGLPGLEDGLYAGFCERLARRCWPPTWCCRRAPAPTASRCSTPPPARSMPAQLRAARRRAAARSVVRALPRRLSRHAADLLLARHRARRTGARSSRSTCSAWASTGATTWPRRCARRRRAGACRAISIRSGCICRPTELERARARGVRSACARCRRRCAPPGSAGSATACCSRRPRTTCAWCCGSSGRCSRERRAAAARASPSTTSPGRATPAIRRCPTGSDTPDEAAVARHVGAALAAAQAGEPRRRDLRAHAVLPRAVHLLRLQHAHHAHARDRHALRAGRADRVRALPRAARRRAARRSANCTSAAARRPSSSRRSSTRWLGGILARLAACGRARCCRSRSIRASPRPQQLQLLARHGFRRISLGVQDFDPHVQDIVNRVQSVEQVRAVTEEARGSASTASTTT